MQERPRLRGDAPVDAQSVSSTAASSPLAAKKSAGTAGSPRQPAGRQLAGDQHGERVVLVGERTVGGRAVDGA